MNNSNIAVSTEAIKDLPDIVVQNVRISEIAEKSIEALKQGNDPVRLVEYGGKLSRYSGGRIERLTLDSLRGEMDRAAHYWHADTHRSMPPLAVVRDILSMPVCDFPKARGILGYPILSRDGAIRTTPGYDPATGWIYDPAPGFVLPDIPARPDRKDTSRAVALIDEMIGQFPFYGPTSRTHAIAAMLTLAARPAIDGCIPMFAFDAPSPGTGKGLLTRAIVRAITGEAAAVTPACEADSEWGKTITSFLKGGTIALLVDNVIGTVSSSALAALLTGTHWKSRLLGTNEIPEFEINAVVFLAGNNLSFSLDIARRVCLCRLDAKCYRPSDRVEDFKHDPLIDWVISERPEIVRAVFVLIRAWFAAGCPAASVRPLASFEPWSRFVGGVLEYAEIDGFLANAEAVQDRGNLESEYFADIIEDIYSFVAGQELTAKEIICLQGSPYWETILPKQTNADGPKVIARELGKMFSKLEGRILTEDGLRVLRVGMRHSAVVWKIVRDLPGGEAGS